MMEHGPLQTSHSKKKPKFQYGNYPNYYGYRNPNISLDPRITCFKKEWFAGKNCLDVGCNSGFVTINIAQLFGPAKIVGVDIDPVLIAKAKSHAKFCFSLQKPISVESTHSDHLPMAQDLDYFPLSCPLSFGLIHGSFQGLPDKFPYNIHFRITDWVHEPPIADKNLYHVVLGVTKWIHLNWGDKGIKRFFNKVYGMLQESGLFILEPQEFETYYKRQVMTEEMVQTYHEINFKPIMFKEYLLGEVGFKSCDTLAEKGLNGFERPLLLFRK